MAFWDSILVLRKFEFVVTLVLMITPVVGSAFLLTLRHRIKSLQSQTSASQGLSFDTHIQSVEGHNHRLSRDLANAQAELTLLRRATAPRQLTESQAAIILEKLRGIKSSPVVLSAYAFEEESAGYAAQIAAVLREAGWEVTANKSSMNDFKGISLGTINLMKKPLSGLKDLADAFSEAHLDLHQRDIAPESIAGHHEDGSLLIVVGRK